MPFLWELSHLRAVWFLGFRVPRYPPIRTETHSSLDYFVIGTNYYTAGHELVSLESREQAGDLLERVRKLTSLAAVLGLCVTITLKLKHPDHASQGKSIEHGYGLHTQSTFAEVTSIRIFHDRNRKRNESQVLVFFFLTILREPLGMLRKGSSLRLWRKDLQVKTPLPWMQDFTNASPNRTLFSSVSENTKVDQPASSLRRRRPSTCAKP
ncbi:uncharacterized protein LOC110316900 [Mus pahari]|uniref:uncharacterized protein LOC110316900 n=1 Tax=Mus pahari TaxID=10093 RepID=UPI000A305E96|nr:uncharacterized protein LOC110316900 [Mus pahari]